MLPTHCKKWRTIVEPARVAHVSDATYGRNGAFRFMHDGELYVICSDGKGWDHVSVSRKDRIPSWEEMCIIKAKFFAPEETVVQYHPSQEEYVNNHSRCLHMWRCQTQPFPCPPSWMVGYKTIGVIE